MSALGRQFPVTGERFSGARQGVRYRGNGGEGAYLMRPGGEQEATLFDRHSDPARVTSDHIAPESVEYGHTATERQHDPTKWNGQMALPGMPKPTDPHLHRLRQQNPNLNDYQFTVSHRTPAYSGGKQSTPHSVVARDANGTRVGMLKLGYEHEAPYGSHPGHREVEELGVAPDHQGKGLAEGMYDLARMKGAKIVHSSERSESGEAFARRTGGTTMAREKGHGADDYLGLDAPRDRV